MWIPEDGGDIQEQEIVDVDMNIACAFALNCDAILNSGYPILLIFESLLQNYSCSLMQLNSPDGTIKIHR
jgi:hypothetical protein